MIRRVVKIRQGQKQSNENDNYDSTSSLFTIYLINAYFIELEEFCIRSSFRMYIIETDGI